MSRISLGMLASAIKAVGVMEMRQKEALADELFRTQPNLLGSVLALQRMGVTLEKMDFALNLLFICNQAMKQTGLGWPLITEEELGRQMARYVAAVRFGEDLSPAQSARAMAQYLSTHPEQPLLAYITGELNAWLARIAPEDSDKYVMLTCATVVNCVAFASIPKLAPQT